MNDNELKKLELIDLEEKYMNMFITEQDKKDHFKAMGIDLFPRIWASINDDVKINLLKESIDNNKKLNELDKIIELENFEIDQILYENIEITKGNKK